MAWWRTGEPPGINHRRTSTGPAKWKDSDYHFYYLDLFINKTIIIIILSLYSLFWAENTVGGKRGWGEPGESMIEQIIPSSFLSLDRRPIWTRGRGKALNRMWYRTLDWYWNVWFKTLRHMVKSLSLSQLSFMKTENFGPWKWVLNYETVIINEWNTEAMGSGTPGHDEGGDSP